MARRRRTDSDTAIGYIRVSTARQAKEGLSLGQQRAAVESYCSLRGLRLAGVVVESGVSGSKPLADRAGGQELAELLRDHRAGAVVAIRLDRVFRDASDCLGTVKGWDRAGVALHLIDMGGQSIDTSGAMGRLFLTMLASFAELERERIGERVSDAWEHKRSKGEKVGRFARYGYRAGDDGKTLEPVEAEQVVIREIKRLRANGLSYPAIREWLESNGYTPRGKSWHVTTVRRIALAG